MSGYLIIGSMARTGLFLDSHIKFRPMVQPSSTPVLGISPAKPWTTNASCYKSTFSKNAVLRGAHDMADPVFLRQQVSPTVIFSHRYFSLVCPYMLSVYHFIDGYLLVLLASPWCFLSLSRLLVSFSRW